MSVVEAGIPAGAVEANACPLCDATSAHASHVTAEPAEIRDDLLSWALCLTLAVMIASVGLGNDRWFGIGAVAGLAVGAACAWQSVRTAVRARNKAHQRATKALNDDADTRVAMVIRQFEWAVNDVAKLKRDHERAQVTADLLIVQGRARERHVRKLEREILESREREAMRAAAPQSQRAEFEALTADAEQAVVIKWALHHDGHHARLELECDARAYRPSRLRVLDPEGNVHTKTMTPMHSGDGTLWFALAEPPAALVAELLGRGETAYRLEAQCNYEWRPVLLEDTGRRTRMVSDKQGHTFRVTDMPDMHAPRASAPVVPAYNPFDHTFDSTTTTL